STDHWCGGRLQHHLPCHLHHASPGLDVIFTKIFATNKQHLLRNNLWTLGNQEKDFVYNTLIILMELRMSIVLDTPNKYSCTVKKRKTKMDFLIAFPCVTKFDFLKGQDHIFGWMFMFAFMSNWQLDCLYKDGQIVCLDSTHKICITGPRNYCYM
ncbi:hypothetical protein BC941DRAFT_441775, partial [Chlamydoabsidia padenii]